MEGRSDSRRIALLSNVNMNAVIRALKSGAEVYEAEGYGNELGTLMNPASSYHAFSPEITFLVLDLLELLEHELREQASKARVEGWFADFENAMQDGCVYYINDAYLWGAELDAAEALASRTSLELLWNGRLRELCGRHPNVRILPYHHMISCLGEENAFSLKMWYMGKMPLSGEAGKRLAALVLEKVRLESRTPKKVLALDLDNTLWGGLAGEHDHQPIVLSDDHAGLAYKNLQRVILQMQRQGVILAIVSKNNPEDAEEILRNHPHMVLRPEHFAAAKINWNAKNENIAELAEELNLGLDSFVFWDDNPQERMLVKQLLPQVTVPEFPGQPEELAAAMTQIFHTYFEKAALTAEDLEKTKQYADNVKRGELKQRAGSFADYLRQLQIVVTRVDAAGCANRLEALLNKTNQFNLTTRRHEPGDVQRIVKAEEKRVFVYRVEDCFGDSGVVAAVLVDVSEPAALIEEFVMSCRVMGKNIEQGILVDVEQSLRAEGIERLRGMYVPTDRNKPVAGLYEQLGYRRLESGKTEPERPQSEKLQPERPQSEEPESERPASQKPGCGDCSRAQLYELDLNHIPDRAFVGEIRRQEPGAVR